MLCRSAERERGRERVNERDRETYVTTIATVQSADSTAVFGRQL